MKNDDDDIVKKDRFGNPHLDKKGEKVRIQ